MRIMDFQLTVVLRISPASLYQLLAKGCGNEDVCGRHWRGLRKTNAKQEPPCQLFVRMDGVEY
jgi:hypothetical protein